jgi:hypothetical protein
VVVRFGARTVRGLCREGWLVPVAKGMSTARLIANFSAPDDG